MHSLFLYMITMHYKYTNCGMTCYIVYIFLYWLFAVVSLIKFFAYNTQKSLLYRLGGKGLFLLQTRFAVKPKHPV